MKKTLWITCMLLAGIFITGITVKADAGDIGYFGGISEGTNLPKTIEKHVPVKPSTSKTLRYKEMVYISGEPLIFTGTIKVTKDDSDVQTKTSGSYTEKYEIDATNAETSGKLDRTIQFTTSFRVVEGHFKKQIVTDSKVTNWNEKITIGSDTYTLNDDFSTFSLTTVEDVTPGVSYYNTSVYYTAQFTTNNNKEISIKNYGGIYGYSQPWSKVESGELTMEIIRDDWQMTVLLNPSLEAKKTMYYDKTIPYPISFDGTYNQRLERDASLKYRINTYHPELTEAQLENSTRIESAIQIEKLVIPAGLDFIEGHWGEEAIKELYSLEVFTETPYRGMEVEAMYRGDFVKAICKAMNIDTSKYTDMKNGEEKPIVFVDVPPEHPLYPYIMAAYDAKLINGSGARFNVAVPIQRQEAFAIYIRVIGLERLSITDQPVTPFKDDHKISDWSRKAIQAGYRLGIIQGDSAGNVNPDKWLSKVEAGKIINNLIDFLREDITESFRKLQS